MAVNRRNVDKDSALKMKISLSTVIPAVHPIPGKTKRSDASCYSYPKGAVSFHQETNMRCLRCYVEFQTQRSFQDHLVSHAFADPFCILLRRLSKRTLRRWKCKPPRKRSNSTQNSSTLPSKRHCDNNSFTSSTVKVEPGGELKSGIHLKIVRDSRQSVDASMSSESRHDNDNTSGLNWVTVGVSNGSTSSVSHNSPLNSTTRSLPDAQESSVSKCSSFPPGLLDEPVIRKDGTIVKPLLSSPTSNSRESMKNYDVGKNSNVEVSTVAEEVVVTRTITSEPSVVDESVQNPTTLSAIRSIEQLNNAASTSADKSVTKIDISGETLNKDLISDKQNIEQFCDELVNTFFPSATDEKDASSAKDTASTSVANEDRDSMIGKNVHSATEKDTSPMAQKFSKTENELTANLESCSAENKLDPAEAVVKHLTVLNEAQISTGRTQQPITAEATTTTLTVPTLLVKSVIVPSLQFSMNDPTPVSSALNIQSSSNIQIKQLTSSGMSVTKVTTQPSQGSNLNPPPLQPRPTPQSQMPPGRPLPPLQIRPSVPLSQSTHSPQPQVPTSGTQPPFLLPFSQPPRLQSHPSQTQPQPRPQSSGQFHPRLTLPPRLQLPTQGQRLQPPSQPPRLQLVSNRLQASGQSNPPLGNPSGQNSYPQLKNQLRQPVWPLGSGSTSTTVRPPSNDLQRTQAGSNHLPSSTNYSSLTVLNSKHPQGHPLPQAVSASGYQPLTGYDGIRFTCPTCHVTYRTKTELDIHFLQHSNAHLNCSICGLRFRDRSAYTQHMALHQNNHKQAPVNQQGTPPKTVPRDVLGRYSLHHNQVPTQKSREVVQIDDDDDVVVVNSNSQRQTSQSVTVSKGPIIQNVFSAGITLSVQQRPDATRENPQHDAVIKQILQNKNITMMPVNSRSTQPLKVAQVNQTPASRPIPVPTPLLKNKELTITPIQSQQQQRSLGNPVSGNVSVTRTLSTISGASRPGIQFQNTALSITPLRNNGLTVTPRSSNNVSSNHQQQSSSSTGHPSVITRAVVQRQLYPGNLPALVPIQSSSNNNSSNMKPPSMNCQQPKVSYVGSHNVQVPSGHPRATYSRTIPGSHPYMQYNSRNHIQTSGMQVHQQQTAHPGNYSGPRMRPVLQSHGSLNNTLQNPNPVNVVYTQQSGQVVSSSYSTIPTSSYAQQRFHRPPGGPQRPSVYPSHQGHPQMSNQVYQQQAEPQFNLNVQQQMANIRYQLRQKVAAARSSQEAAAFQRQASIQMQQYSPATQPLGHFNNGNPVGTAAVMTTLRNMVQSRNEMSSNSYPKQNQGLNQRWPPPPYAASRPVSESERALMHPPPYAASRPISESEHPLMHPPPYAASRPVSESERALMPPPPAPEYNPFLGPFPRGEINRMVPFSSAGPPTPISSAQDVESLTCGICSSDFSDATQLSSHLLTHTHEQNRAEDNSSPDIIFCSTLDFSASTIIKQEKLDSPVQCISPELGFLQPVEGLLIDSDTRKQTDGTIGDQCSSSASLSSSCTDLENSVGNSSSQTNNLLVVEDKEKVVVELSSIQNNLELTTISVETAEETKESDGTVDSMSESMKVPVTSADCSQITETVSDNTTEASIDITKESILGKMEEQSVDLVTTAIRCKNVQKTDSAITNSKFTSEQKDMGVAITSIDNEAEESGENTMIKEIDITNDQNDVAVITVATVERKEEVSSTSSSLFTNEQNDLGLLITSADCISEPEFTAPKVFECTSDQNGLGITITSVGTVTEEKGKTLTDHITSEQNDLGLVITLLDSVKPQEKDISTEPITAIENNLGLITTVDCLKDQTSASITDSSEDLVKLPSEDIIPCTKEVVDAEYDFTSEQNDLGLVITCVMSESLPAGTSGKSTDTAREDITSRGSDSASTMDLLSRDDVSNLDSSAVDGKVTANSFDKTFGASNLDIDEMVDQDSCCTSPNSCSATPDLKESEIMMGNGEVRDEDDEDSNLMPLAIESEIPDEESLIFQSVEEPSESLPGYPESDYQVSVCFICDEPFHNDETLRIHMKSHPLVQKAKCDCSNVSVGQKRKKKLSPGLKGPPSKKRVLRKMVTAKYINSPTAIRVKCRLCNKTFRHYKLCRIHMRTCIPPDMETERTDSPLQPTLPLTISIPSDMETKRTDSPLRPTLPLTISIPSDMEIKRTDSPLRPTSPQTISIPSDMENKRTDSPLRPTSPLTISIPSDMVTKRIDSSLRPTSPLTISIPSNLRGDSSLAIPIVDLQTVASRIKPLAACGVTSFIPLSYSVNNNNGTGNKSWIGLGLPLMDSSLLCGPHVPRLSEMGIVKTIALNPVMNSDDNAGKTNEDSTSV